MLSQVVLKKQIKIQTKTILRQTGITLLLIFCDTYFLGFYGFSELVFVGISLNIKMNGK